MPTWQRVLLYYLELSGIGPAIRYGWPLSRLGTALRIRRDYVVYEQQLVDHGLVPASFKGWRAAGGPMGRFTYTYGEVVEFNVTCGRKPWAAPAQPHSQFLEYHEREVARINAMHP